MPAPPPWRSRRPRSRRRRGGPRSAPRGPLRIPTRSLPARPRADPTPSSAFPRIGATGGNRLGRKPWKTYGRTTSQRDGARQANRRPRRPQGPPGPTRRRPSNSPTPGPKPAAGPPPPTPDGGRPADDQRDRITGVIAGLGILVALAGIAIIAAYAFGRDDDGYFTTGDEPLRSKGYAVTSDELDLGGDPADAIPTGDDLGIDVQRLEAAPHRRAASRSSSASTTTRPPMPRASLPRGRALDRGPISTATATSPTTSTRRPAPPARVR